MTKDTRDWLVIRPDGIAVGYLMLSAYKTAIDAWNGAFQFDTVPDYLSDLNAMHEAEQVLTIEQMEQYFQNLLRVCNPAFCATAAHRAEAFLRTIDKWNAVTPFVV